MSKEMTILLSVVVAATATACSDDDAYQYGDFRYDMVTYAGSDSNGRATFEMLQRDDTGLITLITDDACSINSDQGQRMLLQYIPAGSVDNGVQIITPQGYTLAITDTLRYADHERIDTLAMDSIKLKSIWRTGDYLNVSCQVKYTTEARYLNLVTDSDSRQNDTVHCYLYHDMLGQTAYFWRQSYLSFYVGEVWNLESCSTLRIHLTDVTYPDVSYYDFTKI